MNREKRIKFHLHTFQKQEVKLNRLKVPPRKEYIENYEAKQEREYHKSQNSGDCSKEWEAGLGSISALVAAAFRLVTWIVVTECMYALF